MKKLKIRKFFKNERKKFFSLALFILVFFAASAMKVQAAGYVTGWLWGGSEDCDMDKNGFKDSVSGCGGDNTSTPLVGGDGTINGNETGIGWISMSSKNCDFNDDQASDGGPGCPSPGTYIPSYGVTINDAGTVSGYAWANAGGNPDNGEQNGLGWIQFNPIGGGVFAETMTNGEIRLRGTARFVGIANANNSGNSGGWEGWITMAGTGARLGNFGCEDNNDYGNNNKCNYGVKINSSSNNFSGYAWSELGWIDFSRARFFPTNTPLPPTCVLGSETICSGDRLLSCDKDLNCSNSDSCALTDNTHWTCSKGAQTSDLCPAIIENVEDGKCGTADGKNFCINENIPDSNDDLCVSGTPSLDIDDLELNLSELYEVKWTCEGVCSDINVECSARGQRACGWIETNPAQ